MCKNALQIDFTLLQIQYLFIVLVFLIHFLLFFRIIQLSESGIYNLWKQGIIDKIDKSILVKVKSEVVALEVGILFGTFILTFYVAF